MSLKQIINGGQAFALGGSWGTPSVDNAGSSNVDYLINNSGQILYPGDIVCLDASGTQALLPTTATLGLVFGTVGNGQILSAYPAVTNIAGTDTTNVWPVQVSETPGNGISAVIGEGAGDLQPPTISPVSVVSMGFTNGSATVTNPAALATDMGQYILTPYNATTNPTPQMFQITAVTPGTGYTVRVVAGGGTTFTGTTGTFVVQMGIVRSQLGPGWWPATNWNGVEWCFPTNAVVPVITSGFGLVNVSGATAAAAGDLIGGTDSSPAGSAATGVGIASLLEPYAARNTNLTVLGITGHEPVRALIGRMGAPAAASTAAPAAAPADAPAAAA